MNVKVNIFNRQKKTVLPSGTKLLIRKSCLATLTAEGFKDNCEVDVTIVDDSAIREINKQQRNIDSATDVLSFPLGENKCYDRNPATGAFMLGDIVISAETALRQAELYGHSFEREIAFLTVHSMLHLLGYDHINGGLEQEIMRQKEEQVLNDLGLAVNKI